MKKIEFNSQGSSISEIMGFSETRAKELDEIILDIFKQGIFDFIKAHSPSQITAIIYTKFDPQNEAELLHAGVTIGLFLASIQTGIEDFNAIAINKNHTKGGESN